MLSRQIKLESNGFYLKELFAAKESFFSKNRHVSFAAIRNAHKLRPFCARYLLALSTYTTWFLKKILHLLASLTFFMNIHTCVFQGALEKKHLPMIWLDNPLFSGKMVGLQQEPCCLQEQPLAWQSLGWGAASSPRGHLSRTTPPSWQ